jgi:hypothetical protein
MPSKQKNTETESIGMQSIKEPRRPEPIAGYTRMYLHEYTTPWGEHRKEVHHGAICTEIKDLPGFMEYDNTCHKYLGVSMITMVPVLDSKNAPIIQPIYRND